MTQRFFYFMQPVSSHKSKKKLILGLYRFTRMSFLKLDVKVRLVKATLGPTLQSIII